jgi:glycosyltransferase involved in cell wall biosynthesis
MSIALLEAMASGLPVIVTDTGGTTELVSRGRNGEIVPWGGTRALSNALRTMIDDRSMREAMGIENRERVLPFGWPALAKRYTDLCTRVAAGASASEFLSSSRQAASSIRVWTKER